MWAILIIAGMVVYGLIICCVEAFQANKWLGIIITLYWILFLLLIIFWG